MMMFLKQSLYLPQIGVTVLNKMEVQGVPKIIPLLRLMSMSLEQLMLNNLRPIEKPLEETIDYMKVMHYLSCQSQMFGL